MFRIRDLIDDADAQVAFGLALIAALFIAFLPDVAWDRLVERATYLLTVGGGVIGVIVLRYLLRIAGALSAGRVLAAAAAAPGALDTGDVVTLVEHGSQPQRASIDGGRELTEAQLDDLDRAAGEAADAGDGVPNMPTDIVRDALLAEYQRATRAQASAQKNDRPADSATGAVIAITDLAGRLGIVL
jgi:hypothetical protein